MWIVLCAKDSYQLVILNYYSWMEKKRSEFVVGVIMPKSFNRTAGDVWETPPDIFELACDYFHVYPRLDVASTNENKLCEFHFTENEDGLSQTWFLDSWCNPPYSKASKWIEKAFKENKKNNINIIALLNATTDTYAWQNYILHGMAEIYFISGRLKFFQNGVISKNPSQHPSALVCWRKK